MREVLILDERGAKRSIAVPCERPLRIVVDGEELVTLMTLGAQPELLVLGYLRNQRLIREVTELRAVHVDWNAGIAIVETRAGAPTEGGARSRITGACGLGTAFEDVVEQLSQQATLDPQQLSEKVLLDVIDTMLERDAIHRAAGSVHSAGLFLAGRLHVSIEDVSRHNGIDTVTGWMALNGIQGNDALLFSTGRLTAEVIMKSAYNGIAVMVSRNGTTSLGIDLASRLGMTLVTRAGRGKYIISVGAERFTAGDSTDHRGPHGHFPHRY